MAWFEPSLRDYLENNGQPTKMDINSRAILESFDKSLLNPPLGIQMKNEPLNTKSRNYTSEDLYLNIQPNFDKLYLGLDGIISLLWPNSIKDLRMKSRTNLLRKTD